MITQKSPWRRIALTVSAMLIVLLLAASYRFAVSRGFFASVEDKTPAACHTVDGVSGVTAITPDERTRSALVATRQGGVYVVAGGTATKLSGTPHDFHPVAIALAAGKLQAIFQRADGSYALAVFDVLPGTLVETGRLTTDQLTDPADLAAVDDQRFYLVNKHASHTAFGRWLDDTFLIPRAEVLYFDGMKFIPVAKRLNSPAAVALSPDGGQLVVAQELTRSMASFSRNVFTGALDHPELSNLPAAPTRITVAADGSLIVAAWPKRGAGAGYRVRIEGGVAQPEELLYSSKSDEVTAAAEANGHLLVGSAKGLRDCKL